MAGKLVITCCLCFLLQQTVFAKFLTYRTLEPAGVTKVKCGGLRNNPDARDTDNVEGDYPFPSFEGSSLDLFDEGIENYMQEEYPREFFQSNENYGNEWGSEFQHRNLSPPPMYLNQSDGPTGNGTTLNIQDLLNRENQTAPEPDASQAFWGVGTPDDPDEFQGFDEQIFLDQRGTIGNASAPTQKYMEDQMVILRPEGPQRSSGPRSHGVFNPRSEVPLGLPGSQDHRVTEPTSRFERQINQRATDSDLHMDYPDFYDDDTFSLDGYLLGMEGMDRQGGVGHQGILSHPRIDRPGRKGQEPNWPPNLPYPGGSQQGTDGRGRVHNMFDDDFPDDMMLNDVLDQSGQMGLPRPRPRGPSSDRLVVPGGFRPGGIVPGGIRPGGPNLGPLKKPEMPELPDLNELIDGDVLGAGKLEGFQGRPGAMGRNPGLGGQRAPFPGGPPGGHNRSPLKKPDMMELPDINILMDGDAFGVGNTRGLQGRPGHQNPQNSQTQTGFLGDNSDYELIRDKDLFEGVSHRSHGMGYAQQRPLTENTFKNLIPQGPLNPSKSQGRHNHQASMGFDGPRRDGGQMGFRDAMGPGGHVGGFHDPMGGPDGQMGFGGHMGIDEGMSMRGSGPKRQMEGQMKTRKQQQMGGPSAMGSENQIGLPNVKKDHSFMGGSLKPKPKASLEPKPKKSLEPKGPPKRMIP